MMGSGAVDGALMALSGAVLLVSSIAALVTGRVAIGVFGLVVLMAVATLALDRLVRKNSGH